MYTVKQVTATTQLSQPIQYPTLTEAIEHGRAMYEPHKRARKSGLTTMTVQVQIYNADSQLVYKFGAI